MNGSPRYVVAVDVGTGSARAGFFDTEGRLRSRAVHPIKINKPQADHAEHSSDDIWGAVCKAVRTALGEAKVRPEEVAGISFDATCSLVLLDAGGRPRSVSVTGEDRWNVVVWHDHRAGSEAEEVTASGHKVLDYVGGVMSLEMQMPKFMWLKRNLLEAWRDYRMALDLTDFLVWRASGANERSVCTVTCKWGYLAHEKIGWQEDFLNQLGLDDLLGHAALPEQASPIGHRAGFLTAGAAEELALTTDCAVGVGLIDAHAGALGVLGSELGGDTLDERIAMIAGTSSCHMALSKEPRLIKGVWGPYFGAVSPGFWVNEGGQSMTGALLDHILAWHPQGGEAGPGVRERVVARINELRGEEGEGFAQDLHVLPDFHGNRSPLADSQARGVISGLGLDASFDSLARLYFATTMGIALGTRHILDAMNEKGYSISHIHLTGGHVNDSLLLQLYADVTGCTVVMPEEEDGVLLGTAMVAAAAAGLFENLSDAARAFSRRGGEIHPSPGKRAYYDARYRAFLAMHEHRRALVRIMRDHRDS